MDEEYNEHAFESEELDLNNNQLTDEFYTKFKG